MDNKKVIEGLEYTWEYIRERPNPTAAPKARAMSNIMDAIALLKEQEEQKRRWLQCIADTQLANSPNGNEDDMELKYKSGIWNGLQMAWEILTEEK